MLQDALIPKAKARPAPFALSLGLQCAFVAALAIPWTATTLLVSPKIAPTFLHLVKQAQVPEATPSKAAASARTTPLPRLRAPALVPKWRPGAPAVNIPLIEATSEVGVPAVGVGGPTFDFPVAGTSMRIDAPPPIVARPEETSRVAVASKPVVVGGTVQAAKLIHRVQPAYPAPARQVRVQGVVRLEAVIAVDGSIQALKTLSGHPLLLREAVEAVRQWRYSPTILNGVPVEVKTTIDVNFVLSER